MRHLKVTPSPIQIDKQLNYDLVDMPPFDGLWADRRFSHEMSNSNPQTSLNGFPQNIPRNAELMFPTQRVPYPRQRDHDNFPWRKMRHRRQSSRQNNRNRNRSRSRDRDHDRDYGYGYGYEDAHRTDFFIHVLLIMNFALLLYMVTRQS